MNIVRTPTKVAGGITEEEREALKRHTEKWIANAMDTAPVDRDRLTSAIQSLYRVSGLKKPRVVIVSSPIVMAFAGGFAAAIWWLRKNGEAPPDTIDATYAATRDATYTATRTAARAATLDATYTATRTATRAATDAATHTATYTATCATTLDATDAATRTATHWAVSLADELAGEFGVSRSFLLACAANWWRMYQGGNMWSSYDCYFSAFRDVLGLRIPEYESYSAWESCAMEGGFRLMHEEFCIVCDRPEVLSVDDRTRPHSEVGPSHRWRDGFSLHYWHGVRVPAHVVEQPTLITIAEIRSEQNTEVRRVMIERYGYERYCADADLDLIDECPDDHQIVGLRTAKLWRDRHTDMTLLDVLNSTPEPDGSVRRYVIPVRADAYEGRAGRECFAAIASTWRKGSNPEELFYPSPESYYPVAES